MRIALLVVPFVECAATILENLVDLYKIQQVLISEPSNIGKQTEFQDVFDEVAVDTKDLLIYSLFEEQLLKQIFKHTLKQIRNISVTKDALIDLTSILLICIERFMVVCNSLKEKVPSTVPIIIEHFQTFRMSLLQKPKAPVDDDEEEVKWGRTKEEAILEKRKDVLLEQIMKEEEQQKKISVISNSITRRKRKK